MNINVDVIKRKKFQISTLLCFILPPIGILFLFIMSFVSLYKHWKDKNKLKLSLFTLFFLCLFISTVGAVIQIGNVLLITSSLMILGYWGLYLRVMENGTMDNFHDYKWIIIFGGIYNCIIGWVLKWTIVNPVLGFFIGRELLGDTDYSRLFGSSYNSNFTMYLLLLALAFLFAEINRNIHLKKFRFLSWQIPLLLVLSYGVFDTGSRAGFTAMVVIYLLFFLRLNKIAFFSASILFIIQIKNIFELMPRKDIINYSTAVREKIWIQSIELWEKHFLFGTTPLGFQGEYTKTFNTSMIHAHDLLIGSFAEYGTLGGLAFLVLFGTTIYKSVVLFCYKDNNNNLHDFFLLSLPIIVLTGVLDEPTFSPQIALLTIILLGYWDKYTRNFSFSLITFPNLRLKNLNKMASEYTNMQQKSKNLT